VHRKEWGWSVGLVYELAGVTTARPRVAGVLHTPSMDLIRVVDPSVDGHGFMKLVDRGEPWPWTRSTLL
jgi:hypothetical protein